MAKGNNKPVKRLKRNDLIAQREKQKLKHKLNKELRKERKLNEKETKLDSKKITNQQDKNDVNDKKPKAQKISSYKKAQLEYERKTAEKQKKIEVN